MSRRGHIPRREKLPDPARPHFGFRLVERLNVGFIAGFPAAMVGFLWANRLLPPLLPQRADAEVNVLFAIWGVLLLYAFLRKPTRAWVDLLGLTAGLLLALPVFDMLATDRGLPRTIASGDWTLAGVDLTFLAVGAGFGWAARAVARYRAHPRRSYPAAVPSDPPRRLCDLLAR